MVLPAPAADPGAASAPEWLAKLIRQLERSQRGVLFALTEAVPTQLGTVVRALSPASPWAGEDQSVLEVCLHARELLRVPHGSRVLLRVRSEDLEWLNLHRPIFADRELRAVLWVDKPTLGALVRSAIDLFDWVSRVVPVPDEPLPGFAVANVRSAIAAGDPICWIGEGLHEVLRAAGCEAWVEVDARKAAWDIVEELQAPGMVIVSGLASERDVWRWRMIWAFAQREGAWVARDPGVRTGMWRVEARTADWDEATRQLAEARWVRPALVAAWLDLEPESIEWFAAHPGATLDDWDVQAVASVSAPTWMLRRYGGDEGVGAARALIMTDPGPPPEFPELQMIWSRGAGEWDPEQTSAVEARMVRALQAGKLAPSELVEELDAAGFGDVATLSRRRVRAALGQGMQNAMSYGASALTTLLAEQLVVRSLDYGDLVWHVEARRELASLYAEQGADERAIEQLERCLAISEELGDRSEVAEVLEALGDLALARWELERAEGLFQRAFDIRQELADLQPESDDSITRLALARVHLGTVYKARGAYQQARFCFEDARQTLASLAGADDLVALIHVRDRLADLFESEGEFEQARRQYAANVQAWERIRRDRQHERALVTLHGDAVRKLGCICLRLGDLDAATNYLELGLLLTSQYWQQDPNLLGPALDVVRSRRELGDLYDACGDIENSRFYHAHALELARELLERNLIQPVCAWELAVCLEHLAGLHRRLGDIESALSLLELSRALLLDASERRVENLDMQLDLAILHRQLGEVLRLLERSDEAKRSLEQARAILERLHARMPLDETVAHEYALVLATLGHERDLAELRERALELLKGLQDRGVLRGEDQDLLAALSADAAASRSQP